MRVPATDVAPRGELVLGYYTAAESVALARHEVQPLLAWVRRARFRSLELSAQHESVADVEIEAPAGDLVVSGFVDTHHDFLHSIFGGGDGTFVGRAATTVDTDGNGAVTVSLVPAEPTPPATESCVGPRVQLVTIDAPEVAGRIGNDTHRRLCVSLPASYETERRRRYPVIYWFPGLGGGDSTYLSIRDVFERVVGERRREAIVVGVDTRTAAGSSYLEDAALTGNWQHFVAETIPQAIDARFRTIRRATARSAAGHSTGGFNAVSIAMRRPDVFGVVGASSPDALDFSAWMIEPDGHRARPLWLAWTRLEDAIGGAGQIVSYAMEWSPDANAARGVRWPFDLETGELVVDVWNQWLDHIPVTWLDREDGLARARRLSAHMYLTCGSADEFGLFEPAERFHAALSAHGIDHVYAPTPYGHFGHGDERFAPMFRYLLGTLDPAQ